jgi:DNA gyrase subunit A
VAIATRSGQLVRFNEAEVRAMGRGAGGVRGANVGADDRVVATEVVRPGATLLTVSANGMGKRSSIDDYRLTRRGSHGVKTMNVTPKTGAVMGVLQILDDDDEVMIVTNQGKMIRIAMRNVRVLSRNTQGVSLVRLDLESGEQVASVAPVAEKESEAEIAGDEE